MKGMERVTAAPMPITLGGTTYQVSALVNSPAALGHVQQAIKDRRDSPLDMLTQERLDRFAPKQQQMMIDAAVREESKRYVAPTSEEIDEFMNSIDGVATLLHFGIVQNHPEVALETIRDAVIQEGLDIMQAKLDAAGGFSELGESSAGEETEQPTDDETPGPKSTET